jgi:hypothetical protein
MGAGELHPPPVNSHEATVDTELAIGRAKKILLILTKYDLQRKMNCSKAIARSWSYTQSQDILQ